MRIFPRISPEGLDAGRLGALEEPPPAPPTLSAAACHEIHKPHRNLRRKAIKPSKSFPYFFFFVTWYVTAFVNLNTLLRDLHYNARGGYGASLFDVPSREIRLYFIFFNFL